MDWYVEASDAASVHDLRQAIAAHLARHADDGADVGTGEIAEGKFWKAMEQRAPVPRAWQGGACTRPASDLPARGAADEGHLSDVQVTAPTCSPP